MAYSQAQFEKDLRTKLSQKVTSRLTEEGIIMKNFKYFDLNNSGTVDFNEFVRALEKTGVIISDEHTFRGIFDYYDTNGDGQLDYREFCNLVLKTTPTPSSQSQQQFQQSRPATTQSQREPTLQNQSFVGAHTSNAPYGVSNQQLDYTTSSRPQNQYQNQSPYQQRHQQQPTAGYGAQVGGFDSQQSGYGQQAGGYGGQPGGFGAQPQHGTGKRMFTPQKQDEAQDSQLLEILRNKVIARGTRGIFALGRLFRIIDDNNSKTLELNEFLKVLKDFRVQVSEQEARRLFEIFDRDRSGQISYDEFLRNLRGNMNSFRQGLVQRAFDKLDRDRSGVVTLDDVIGVYDASKHPEVVKGKKSEEEVLGDFLDTFEQHHAIMRNDSALRNRTVTFEEFLEYYENISCSIDDDKYFEVMIVKAWDLDNTKNAQNRQGWRNY